jgi:putative ABC transport system permease protein
VDAGIKPVLQNEEGSCYEPVSSDFFRMLEIPVLKGRGFTDWDSENSPPVAVISESVARRYFNGEDPVGKLISIGLWDFDDIERREVVGVVPDIRQSVV